MSALAINLEKLAECRESVTPFQFSSARETCEDLCGHPEVFVFPKTVPPKFEEMTANDKIYKTGTSSAFATAFSGGAPFPGLQSMCSGKLGFATAVAKQKHLVGETHPLRRSLFNHLFKSPRAEWEFSSA